MSKPAALTVAQMIHEKSRKEGDRHMTAKATYLRLMYAESATEADVKELADAAEALGITHGQIVADHAAITEAKALVRQIDSLADGQDVHQQLNAIVQAHRQTLDADIARLKRQHQLLELAASDAWDRVLGRQGAEKRLAELQAKFGVLVGIPFVQPRYVTVHGEQQPNPDYYADVTGASPEAVIPRYAEWLAARVALQPVSVEAPNAATPAAEPERAAGPPPAATDAAPQNRPAKLTN